MARAGTGSRGATASSIGMMEGAFFVSRTELLQWVNNLLQISLTKIEQCASGAVYCQIIDSCSLGTISMRKVNWMAKSDHEFIPNYKLLQAAFDRNGIERHIDVDKLIRAKYQDNLEFLQWMKCHWERAGGPDMEYDPIAAREGRPMPSWASAPRCTSNGGALPVSSPPCSGGDSTPRRQGRDGEPQRPPSADVTKRTPAASTGNTGKPAPQRQTSNVDHKSDRPKSGGYPTPALQNADGKFGDSGESVRERRANAETRSLIAAQAEEITKLKATLSDVENERNFYYRKFRDVEVFCTTLQARMHRQVTPQKVLEEILGLLAAEDEDDADMEGPGSDISHQIVTGDE